MFVLLEALDGGSRVANRAAMLSVQTLFYTRLAEIVSYKNEKGIHQTGLRALYLSTSVSKPQKYGTYHNL